jgi:hypothetical protein
MGCIESPAAQTGRNRAAAAIRAMVADRRPRLPVTKDIHLNAKSVAGLFGLFLIAFPFASPAAHGADTGAAGDPPPTLEEKCTSDEGSDFRQNGGGSSYVYNLQNKCAMALRCMVNVYVITPFGAKRGEAALILAAKSQGADARKSYVLKIRYEAVGHVYREHHCKVL